ncbi:MAG: hypothetical protein DMG28_11070 [Acidobacteria bacterium]|nr:MAG: hypothetical protein DMG28_11070 [Acidobacteriota bacterium]
MSESSKHTSQRSDEHSSPGMEAAEQRTALRYPFSADAEVIELPSGPRSSARTSDLGLEGCYIDTLNPFPVKSLVRLRIHKGGKVLDVEGRVRYRHPGLGMGIAFVGLTAGQQSVIFEWLAENGLDLKATSKETPSAAEMDGSLACRLVYLLVRKGILSEQEAVTLLRDGFL